MQTRCDTDVALASYARACTLCTYNLCALQADAQIGARLAGLERRVQICDEESTCIHPHVEAIMQEKLQDLMQRPKYRSAQRGEWIFQL
jgi:hypothetical protein